MEIVVVSVKLLEERSVNLILKLGDAKVLNLDRIGNGPLDTNGDRGERIGVLQKLKLSATVEGLTLQVDDQRLTVQDVEEHTQVVQLDFFRIVID